MAITVVSVADNVKRELSDLDSDLWSEDADVLTRIVTSNVVGTETTFSFQKIATGWYQYQGVPTGLFIVGTTPYTTTATASTFYAGTDKQAPSIELTTGTDTATTITVTATAVNFAEIVAQSMERVALQNEQMADTFSVGGANQTISSSKLRKAARSRRGAYGA